MPETNIINVVPVTDVRFNIQTLLQRSRIETPMH